MLYVSESGLFSLTMKSRKPEAKAFQKWITKEVLPAIRKTGSYSVGPAVFVLEEKRMKKCLCRTQFRLTSLMGVSCLKHPESL